MKKIYILSGPTGVGKTELSLKLAKILNAEIISADSMQIYKFMDIGTGKIRQDEMMGVKHHMLDIVYPNENYNVLNYKNDVNIILNDIYKRGKVPLIVGGTGFYIQAILYNIDFLEKKEIDLDYLDEYSDDELYKILQEIDYEYSLIVHKNNRKRVLKAVKFNKMYNKKLSEHNEAERNKQSPYDYKYFVLINDRDIMYKNSELRIDKMLENGLIDEVKKIMSMFSKDSTSLQAIGYKEIVKYLTNEYTYDEAIYELKKNTRHYIKRQLTWFNREKAVIYIDKKNKKEDDIVKEILCYIESENK